MKSELLKLCVCMVIAGAMTALPLPAADMAADAEVTVRKITVDGVTLTLPAGMAPEEGQRLRVVVDPATGERYVESVQVVTNVVRAPVVTERVVEHIEVPVEAQASKARLAVLPAVFSQHFKPEIRFRELLEGTGQLNFRLVFSTEYEARMTAPSFTLSLAEAFVNSRKFEVLERARLTEALREIDFGQSDYADVDKVVPMGRALNAEYVVLPEIELIHLVEEVRRIPYVDTVQLFIKGKMVVRGRVVDTGGTRVVAASSEEVQVERRIQANNPFVATEAHNLVMDLYRAAGMRLLHRTLEAVYPVRILDVTGNRVVLNRGVGAIDVGDEFNVYSLGRAYVDPDTGEMLGRREEHVAVIRVSRTGPKFSDAEVLEGAHLLRGDVSHFLCRETDASIRTKTSVEQRPLAW